MISKKKFGTTVTAFGVVAGMLLSSAAPAHAEETAKTVQETQKEQADAPSTQSETGNENAEKTIAPAEETEKPGEETAASSDETAASTDTNSERNAGTVCDPGAKRNTDANPV